MNQKDYKAISEIIKNSLTKDWVGGLSEIDKIIIECEKKLKNVIATKLADYFEREGSISKTSFGTVKEYPSFNRKQFLKDAGVE